MKPTFPGYDPSVTGLADPHQTQRDYALRGTPLVGLLDNPMYPPYVRDALHGHNCMEIGFCLSGSGTIVIEDREWRFASGTIIVVPRGVRHKQDNEGVPVTHWRYVLVDQDAFLNETPMRSRAAMQHLFGRFHAGVYLAAGQSAQAAQRTMEEMYSLYHQRYSLDSLELDALLHLLIAQLFHAPDQELDGVAVPANERRSIEPALQYVSENYTQEVRMADMAASCAMSESYFRKVFSRIMGMPPLEYVNRYRINRSINLLRFTDETVQSIAGRTGFPSIATYNRNFHRYVGLSPAQWRKNAHE